MKERRFNVVTRPLRPFSLISLKKLVEDFIQKYKKRFVLKSSITICFVLCTQNHKLASTLQFAFYSLAALTQSNPFNIAIANESTSYEPLFSGGPNHGNNTYVISVHSRMLRYIRIEKDTTGIMSICEINLYKRGMSFFT